MNYLYVFGYILIILSIFLLLLGMLFDRKKDFKLRKRKKDKYAILIPARDESAVIDGLLKSIKIQNKDMSNVYVIVETEDDPTCDITEKYGANVFVRPKPIRSRKGYALDECIKNILESKKYDLYFIFDADNVLDKSFISNMLKAWYEGYEVAIGYRNILNPQNVVSCSSGLMFILFNLIMNKNIRMRTKQPIMLSGTGFYISGDLIDKWHGFPFYTLTEDYELSTYIYQNNIASTYVESAIYYDEQPLTMKISIKQRSRWVKGFFEKRTGKLKNEKYSFYTKVGVIPVVLLVCSCLMLFICGLVDTVYSFIQKDCIMWSNFFLLGIPLYVYLVLFFATYYTLKKEGDKLEISKGLKKKCLFFMPIFLIGFLISFLRSVFKKELTWEKVEHFGK